MEVYVNDMLNKSRSLEDHLMDLEENFIVMNNNNFRINSAKCVFEVMVRKFLGFMLIEKGIEVNLAKCKAILSIRSPTII